MNILLVASLCSFVYNVHDSSDDYKPKNSSEEYIFENVNNKFDYYHDKKYGGCFISIKTNDNKLLVVFRGSDEFRDWEENVEIEEKKPEIIYDEYQDLLFHQGFYHQYQGIEKELKRVINEYLNTNDNKEIIFTGHSSGGAVCSISSYMINYTNTNVVTFGTPKFVNKPQWFIDKCNIYCRVCNYKDPVPYLYELNKYEHVNSKIILFKNDKTYYDDLAAAADKLSFCRLLINFIFGKTSISEHHQSKYIELIKTNNIQDLNTCNDDNI